MKEAKLEPAPFASGTIDRELPFFRPAALEQPRFGEAFGFAIPGWRGLGLLACAGLLLCVAFGLFANFDRVAQVRGIVAPGAGVSRIAAPQAGFVSRVLVRQGAVVAQGTPLLRIASGAALPNGEGAGGRIVDTYRGQLAAGEARQDAERRRRGAEARRLAEEERGFAASAAALRDQSALQRERIANNEERLRNLASLRARGYVSDVTYQAQQEAVLTLRQQMAGLRQQEAEAGQGLREARLRAAELGAGGTADELQSAASLLALERGAAGAEVAAEVTLTAPVAGVVSNLRAVPGMAVAPGGELAAIVPVREALEVWLFVPPAAAGSLRPGQDVTLRYDAFPYQQHGVGRGVIVDVATSASVERPGAEPAYRVRVRLLDPGRLALRPDMTLSAAITLERRSLLDWLLGPLRERWREGRRPVAA